MLFVTIITTAAKSPVFIFSRKSTHLYLQQSNLVCSSQTKHGTRIPQTPQRSFYRFLQIKSLQLLDVKA